MNTYISRAQRELSKCGIMSECINENILKITGRGKNVPLLTIAVIFNNGDIKEVRYISRIMEIGNDIYPTLEICNKVNSMYDYVKFYIKDTDILCSLDLCFYEDTFPEDFLDYMRLLIAIIDDNYKELLISTIN